MSGWAQAPAPDIVGPIEMARAAHDALDDVGVPSHEGPVRLTLAARVVLWAERLEQQLAEAKTAYRGEVADVLVERDRYRSALAEIAAMPERAGASPEQQAAVSALVGEC